jgi:hypothetical protein
VIREDSGSLQTALSHTVAHGTIGRGVRRTAAVELKSLHLLSRADKSYAPLHLDADHAGGCERADQ